MSESPTRQSRHSSNIIINQTPKSNIRRHSELSPEDEESVTKKQCQSMSEAILELKIFMNEMKTEIKEQMSMMNQKIEELSMKFESKVELLLTDVKQVKEEVENVRTEMLDLEEDNSRMNKNIKSNQNQLNALNQLMLENQLTMVNIASTVNEEIFLDDMNKWSNNILNNSLMSYNFSSNAKYKSKAVHLHFNTLNDKKKFTNFLKTKQKDANMQYIPVLNEHIFTLKDSDVNRANTIDFRTPMTKINREIFNKARKAKKNNNLIEGIWISRGSIKISIKNMKPVLIDDIEHLKEVFSSMNIEMPKD